MLVVNFLETNFTLIGVFQINFLGIYLYGQYDFFYLLFLLDVGKGEDGRGWGGVQDSLLLAYLNCLVSLYVE